MLTILYISANFLLFLLSSSFSQPVLKCKDRETCYNTSCMKLNFFYPVGISNATSVQTSDAYSNKGCMYVNYNLFNVSLDNLYLSFLKSPICFEAESIIKSVCLVHLFFDDKITPKCL